jgi:hypothetical protein
MRARSFIRLLLPSRAFLRLTAYSIFAFFALALLAARILVADVKEAALSAGHELAQLADLLDGTETIRLNGERLHHGSTYTDQDVTTVLDRFEAYCAASPSTIGRAMSDFPKELAGEVEKRIPDHAARLGFVRDEAKGRGMVACLVSDQPTSSLDLAERLDHFMTTARLGEFGKFRYAFAERLESGRTHVITTWADTGLDIRAMFPSQGDAAGSDSPVLPRPPNARRTLSAAAEGLPYGLRLYEATDSADSLRIFYEGWMHQHGFATAEGGERHGTVAYLRDDGYQVFVAIGEHEGRASVTLLEAGRTNAPSTAAVQVTE